MTRSMTGYGRADFSIGAESFSVEVKSLNHRYLDMKIRAPERFYWAEERIRAEVKGFISRGNIAIFIKQTSWADPELTLNIPYIEACKKAADEIKAHGIEGSLTVDYLLNRKEAFIEKKSEADAEGDWSALKAGIHVALSAVDEWREQEGGKLREDLLARLKSLAAFGSIIDERVPQIASGQLEKIRRRIEELIEREVDETRLLTEAAIAAEKSAIDEEIVRLKSHLESFTGYLDDIEPVGRKLDFLCQELLREINTIGSKVSEVELTATVVEMKAELEKIREQVQNIE